MLGKSATTTDGAAAVATADATADDGAAGWVAEAGAVVAAAVAAPRPVAAADAAARPEAATVARTNSVCAEAGGRSSSIGRC